MTITLDGNNANTVGVINSATAKNSTSGTAIDFTGIPAGTKRITVMFNGVSTNGSSNLQVQVGSGSVTATGYSSVAQRSGAGATSTTGFLANVSMTATYTLGGAVVISLVGSNTWVSYGSVVDSGGNASCNGGTGPALSGALDRVRITTVNGTDTFDAGSINILYE